MDETKDPKRYQLDTQNTRGSSASLSLLIAVRKCYKHRPEGNEHSAIAVSPEKHIREIQRCCAKADDYLLPDTPIKEAVFRVMVAGGNKPVTAEAVSADLSARWEVSTYPRDLSTRVVERVLANGQNYFIHELPEPEPESQLVRRAPAEAKADDEA